MPNLLPIFGECILSIFVLDKLNKCLTRLPPRLVHLHCYTSSRNSHPYNTCVWGEGGGKRGWGEGMGGGQNKQELKDTEMVKLGEEGKKKSVSQLSNLMCTKINSYYLVGAYMYVAKSRHYQKNNSQILHTI